MLERLLKYWPLIAASALAIVSVFNIGYFSIVGPHFIGVMDWSNIVYPVGLVFGIIIVPLVFIPQNIVDILKQLASSKNPIQNINQAMKWSIAFIGLTFTIGIFIHRPYVSIMTLFAIYFCIAFIIFSAYFYAIYLLTNELNIKTAASGVAFGMFTLFWIGGAAAYHEAFGSTKLYNVVTKGNVTFDSVRIARTSSNGFIIGQHKKIVFIPSGEIKIVSALDPVDRNSD